MSTGLIPATGGAMVPTAQEWKTLAAMARVAIESGLLPPHVKGEQAAIFIAMKGRELSIPTTYAWSNISVIGGKPVCSAELMLALIYRDHGGQAITFEETTDAVCRVSYQRRDAAERRPFAFTRQQATAAGLTGGNWAKYPAAMLRARCVSAVARMAFADSIAGMYTPEELGAPVTVTSDGEVVLSDDEEAQTAQSAATAASANAPIKPLPSANLARSEPVTTPPGDAAREQAVAALKQAVRVQNWTPADVLATATSLWPHITTQEDFGTLTAAQVDILTGIVRGRADVRNGQVIEPPQDEPSTMVEQLAQALR